MAVNVLEAIRFMCRLFVHLPLLSANWWKVMQNYQNDCPWRSASSKRGTQHMINLMQSGKDDPEMVEIAEARQQQAIEIFKDAVEQEKAWAKYLFLKMAQWLALNEKYLGAICWVHYQSAYGCDWLTADFAAIKNNPIPWIKHCPQTTCKSRPKSQKSPLT